MSLGFYLIQIELFVRSAWARFAAALELSRAVSREGARGY